VAVDHLRVRESLAELDDEFPDGEQHFRVPLESSQIVEAFTLDQDGTRHPLMRCLTAWPRRFPPLPRPGTRATPGGYQ